MLARNHATAIMNKSFRQHDRSRQIVGLFCSHRIAGDGCDRRIVRPTGTVRREARGQIRSSRQHDVVTGGVLIGAVGERSAERPHFAALGKLWQVLANLQPRRLRRARLEFTAYVVWRVGLHIEAIVLGQATGKEYKNA